MGIKGKGFYKGKEISFGLPEGWNLLAMAEPKDVPGMADVATKVRELLADPIGMAPLADVVAGLPHKKTVIISEDQTRPTPVSQVLNPLWAELGRLGIADGEIDVIIGRGTHRRATEDEVRAKVGHKAVERLRVTVHDPDADDVVHIGTTSRGTEVRVNPLVAEAAVIIGIGTSNPHYFAGYGGGAKLILPGVCARETVKQNHVWIRDPRAVAGVMEGNPIWEDMLEAARMAHLTFKFDTVVNANKEIYQLFGGEVEAQQKAAVEVLKQVYGVAVPALADVTVASGYPLETNFVQSGKAVLSADVVTKPGGTIVLVSACSDGPGPMVYETLSQRPTSDQVIEWIDCGEANTSSGPMAARLRSLVASKRLLVVTDGLSEQQLADMEFDHAPTIEQAIAGLAAGNGHRDAIVLPVGGSTFAYLAESS
jgi:nickel-dependent lactate racemase